MKRKLFLPLFIGIIAATFFSFVEKEDPLRKTYAETITAADLKMHLSIIASDSFEGRETAKKGQHMTAEYIARQFMSFGIPPPISGKVIELAKEMASPDSLKFLPKDYYQNVPLRQLTPGNGTVTANEKKYSFGTDFYYTPGIQDGQLENSQIVFAGYGIQDSLYKDYCCSGVFGKIEMIISDEPLTKKGKSIITGNKELSSWSTQRRRKVNEAKRRGALALLVVIPDYQKRFAEYKDYIEKPTLELDEPDTKNPTGDDRNMPVLYISKEMADEILKAGKQEQTIDKIISKTAKTKTNVHFEFVLPMKIDIQRKSEKLHSENVLGYIEGTDLKNELVVVTAHMDHLGIDTSKTGDQIFNGADDDGSGTVSVLEMAQAFAKAKKDGHGPRRSILFMCVTGEEKGLLGSRWYTDNPVFPLASTVVDLNIDMIGRIDDAHKNDSNYVYVIGSDKLSSELKTINETENATYTGMKLDYRYDVPNEPNNYYGRSDHYNFAKHFIPIAFFFNGVHADYHKETDEVSKINFPLMEKRARLVFYDAWEIANRDKRLVVDKK
jgi:hypothetical protein